MNHNLKYISIGLILVLISIVSSCDMGQGEDTNNITLTLPSIDNLRLSANGDDYARIYLFSFDEIFPLEEGNDYKEFPLSSNQQSVTLEDIPAGTDYRLMLSIGTKPDTGGFDVEYYGDSSPFEITPGNTTRVNIALNECAFSKAREFIGKNVTGIVIDITDLYVSTEDEAYRLAFNDTTYVFTITGGPQTFPGYTINSIGRGLGYNDNTPLPPDIPDFLIFVNTDRGIITWDGASTTNYDFSEDLGEVPILKSCAFSVDNHVAVYFNSTGGFGGAYQDAAEDDPNPHVWINIDQGGYFLRQPVFDITVVEPPSFEDSAYFAANFGSYRLTRKLVETYIGGDADYMGMADFFDIITGGKQIAVLSLGFHENTLYIGTEKGLWQADMGDVDQEAIVTSPVRIPGTEDAEIILIAAGYSHVAFCSPYYLYIYNKTTEELSSYPFVAGLPGEISDMEWYNPYRLILSGTEGLVALPLMP
jgi:hypothetical protein